MNTEAGSPKGVTTIFSKQSFIEYPIHDIVIMKHAFLAVIFCYILIKENVPLSE